MQELSKGQQPSSTTIPDLFAQNPSVIKSFESLPGKLATQKKCLLWLKELDSSQAALEALMALRPAPPLHGASSSGFCSDKPIPIRKRPRNLYSVENFLAGDANMPTEAMLADHHRQLTVGTVGEV